MEQPRATAAENIILRWDSTASDDARPNMIFNSDRQEIDLYLSAADELLKSMSSAALSDDSSAPESSTLQIAMDRLEDEFRNILRSNGSPIETDLFAESTRSEFTSQDFDSSEEFHENDFMKQLDHQDTSTSISSSNFKETSSSSTSSCYRSTSRIRELDLIPTDAVYDLRCIAERMIAAGYQRQCVQAYASVRKSAVDTSLKNLKVEKLSIGDLQRLEWETQETKIRRWIRAAKICIRMLFASERRLCEEIFEGLGDSIDDACFMETIKGPAVQLFNFAEAISISKRSPEKLFKTLDLHDTLADLMPDIETVFDSQSSESIRVQAAEISSRLAEAARGILSEFENAVLREPSKVPILGGTIHPLTRYVMNYISVIPNYKENMTKLIVSKPSTGPRYSSDPSVPDMDFSEYEGQASTLALHLIWIIVILQFNLDGKSKHYKDDALAHLFMMNNVHYIVEKIKGSPDLREMIGDYYLKKLTGKIRYSATNYLRATWVRVLHCLRDEGLHVSGSFSSGVSKTALRDRFKAFNAMFEEVHRSQASWLIPDTQLREELRISILEKIIPAYRSFLGRFRSHIESGRHPENYIKYSVEELENAVLDFFEGYPVSQHLRRKHH